MIWDIKENRLQSSRSPHGRSQCKGRQIISISLGVSLFDDKQTFSYILNHLASKRLIYYSDVCGVNPLFSMRPSSCELTWFSLKNLDVQIN